MFGWLKGRFKDGGADLSIVSLIKRLADDALRLVRAEIRLAQAEVRQNVAEIAKPLAMLAFGLLLSVAALFTLMAAFVAWLTPLVGAGFAAFIVATAAALSAGLLIASAIRKIGAVELMPSRAVALLKEEIEEIKESNRG
jgi:uncharacterized membrane protein YqjE